MRRLALAALLCAACSNDPDTPASFAGIRTITLRGRALLSDGSPAHQRSLQVRFLGDGDLLFPSGVNDCSEGDDHAQALQVIDVVTEPDGTFFVSAPVSNFVRATDETCTMSRRQAGHLTQLDVKVQTDADQSACAAWCRNHSEAECVTTCTAEGQKFLWTTSMTSHDLGADYEVRLEELGPALDTSGSDPDLPDLMVDGVAAATSLEIDRQTFADDACEIADGCIGASGERTLLRFDGAIDNLGAGDLVLGDPANSPYFTFSECHGHYHLKGLLTSELVDPVTGSVVVTQAGRVVSLKEGFCLKDIDQVAGDLPGKYDCSNQGLTPGWSDFYSSELSCQWLDVTGVPPGSYTLRLTVNATHALPESSYGNNSALIPVTVP
ncbi:MAG TPA: lysyl oxidase family protein [Myxococcales bacterium]|nr:lysyl oxidase family protein [Myxococcales bacterium]